VLNKRLTYSFADFFTSLSQMNHTLRTKEVDFVSCGLRKEIALLSGS